MTKIAPKAEQKKDRCALFLPPLQNAQSHPSSAMCEIFSVLSDIVVDVRSNTTCVSLLPTGMSSEIDRGAQLKGSWGVLKRCRVIVTRSTVILGDLKIYQAHLLNLDPFGLSIGFVLCTFKEGVEIVVSIFIDCVGSQEQIIGLFKNGAIIRATITCYCYWKFFAFDKIEIGCCNLF